MKLHSYFRSSAAFRVRIALNLKGLPYDTVPVHLLRDGGAQHGPEFRAINPAGLVPVLELDDGRQVLTQSLAIIEYLDETHPEPSLLPGDALSRAQIRALALAIACEIHPLNNLRVLRYLKRTLGVSDAQKDAWYRHWVEVGLAAFEAMLAGSPQRGSFCHGDSPTLADVCLIPQIYNARRFGCDIDGLPRIMRAAAACEALDAFRMAAPENQPDAE